ncbi:MAG: NAD(P)H-hydrate dehydratase [Bacteroidales bacterium]|nr:NAD(P)H-hydrate dehydratase [Bacteroidales bacterium]
MKILNVSQIREADNYTIVNEPIASVDLMERAAGALFDRMKVSLSMSQEISIFCGVGNNGGDGLALSRMLLGNGNTVKTYVVKYSQNSSNDFVVNLGRLKETAGNQVYEIIEEKDIPQIKSDCLVIDAIFGTGLSRKAESFVTNLIRTINASGAVVISVDIPSGLIIDRAVDLLHDAIIHADYTFTFQFPKLPFLFPEYELIVGRWEVLPIGLHPGIIESLLFKDNYLTSSDIMGLIKKRSKFSHKGSFGHALLIAGSEGKSGAAILAAGACLRSGVGLLHVHLPGSATIPMQISLPEAMLSIDPSPTHWSKIPDLSGYNAIGIGPGIGKNDETIKAMKFLIQEVKFPMVFDADALNILSENKTWLAFLPAGSILTPHPKEFERLVGKWTNSYERLRLQKELSTRFKIIVVVKGAHTTITDPLGNSWFNSTGNPGMATGGSGDVLTGIILGLLAQGYMPIEAAKLGVYLHGLAGDIAADVWGYESLIAGDIVENIGKAFKKLMQ